jgi:signal transduction histidine kinase
MTLTAKDLKQVPDLSEVPEDQLEWLLQRGELLSVKEGDVIFKTGDPIDRMFIVLEGRFKLTIKQNGNLKQLGVVKKNEITGFLPYSRATTAMGIAEADSDGQYLCVSKDTIREMTTLHYELTAALVHIMTNRTREFTRQNVQSEKMMALGKLSAGLAHELNNPASAISRSARELKKHVNNSSEKFKLATTMKISGDKIDALADAVAEILSLSQECHLSLLERTEKEDETEEWLDDQGLDNSYELAPALVEYCVEISHLEKILDITGKDNFAAALEWMEHLMTTEKMVADIQDASERISGLVSSIKRYTHMDSAPEKHAADIRQGIKSTLTMLNHKIKKNEITVDQDYSDNLAEPCILVGDINQVWTNLIDNALDAMKNGGTLKIKAYNDKEFVVVEFSDNGKGIPEENIHAIFDPFFTTKAIGEGTGLGLDIVRRIIEQHQGEINVTSRKGETTFTLKLPIKNT